MNEADARAVTWVQAFESLPAVNDTWTDDDRAWATRLALQDTAGRSAPAFLAVRARHALQRLAERQPTAAHWLLRPLWRTRWLVWAAVLGLVAGVAADAVGTGQRINLLAPPLWGILLWNLLVYLVWLGHLLARALARPTRHGPLTRALRRLMRLVQWGQRPPDVRAGATDAGGWQAFAGLWWQRCLPLTTARATALVHTAAAALGVGLIAGLYLRGLVLDYRAGWESTFLDAASVQRLLGWWLAPARAWLPWPWPDGAAFEALRGVHGVASPGAPAAPWIHWLALTVAMVVVLPRTALALGSGLRAAWLAHRFPVDLDDPYVQRLLRQRRGEVARVWVLPYAEAVSSELAQTLPRGLAAALGDGVTLQLGAAQPYGADTLAPSALPAADTTHVLTWFDLAGTPEADVQGRFLQQVVRQLPRGVLTVLCVDEAAFRQRFGAPADRLTARREVWRRFAEGLHSVPVFIDSQQLDADALALALQVAVRQPVSAGPAA